MTRNEKVELLKTITEETDETLLISYLVLAETKILNHLYPFETEERNLPHKYDSVHVELASHLISRIGMEGEIARTENGVVHEFQNGDVPDHILKKIIPYAGVLR